MKKFIAKLFIFLLVITSLICCVNAAYIKMDRSDSQDIKKFKTIPKSVKVCNFGSSHSLYGFNYADVNGIDSFSFALSSQVLSYDRRIFENYLDNISEGAVVFITVSYFSFCIDDERNYSDFPQKNKRYYQILPPQLVKDYDLKTDIYSHYLPSLSAGMDLFTVLSGKSTENKEIDWTEKAINKDLIQDAETVSKRHLSFYAKDEAGNRISNQEEVDSLIYMIKKCKEKGCTPVLITTPYTKEYMDIMMEKDPDFVNFFYEQLGKVIAETGVLYYDYSSDARFLDHYEWFYNSDHLNEEGARQFVNILMDEVVHYGTDKSLIR